MANEAGITTAIYDPYDAATIADPYDVYRVLRDVHPVYHNPQRGFWAVSRFDDVAAVLQNNQAFSNRNGITLTRQVEPPMPMLTNLDPPRHHQLRTLVSHAFTPRRIAALEDQIRTLTSRALDEAGAGGPFDFVAAVSSPIPVAVIAELTGIPNEDRMQFRRWADDSNSGNPDDPGSEQRILTAVIELAQYLYAFVTDRRRSPGDDLVSSLLTATVDGEQLTDLEIVGFCLLLLVAGSETITGLIGTTALNLHAHPDQRRLLADDPGLMVGAVEEFLRFGGSVHVLTRTATRNVVLHDTVIPEGAMVLALYAAANRDDRRFDRAEIFDVRRDDKRHIAFGHGIHHCLGAALARLEARVTIGELLRRSPSYDVEAERVRWAHSPLTRGPAELTMTLGRS